MTKLTPALVSTRHPDTHLQDLKSVDLRACDLDDIDDLSPLVALRKLCLKDNRLINESLEGLAHCGDSLTTLDLSGNQLESFANLQGLHNLISLTVSNNQINRLSTHLLGCKNLKALVAVGNQIAKIENLGGCAELNTLVISHNKVTELSNLAALKELTKINASHNPIRVIPDLRANDKLKELRLNDCKLLTVPETIRWNPALELVNLGNNLIKSFTDIVHLASLPNLIDLNLKGNPITSEPDYEEKVKTLFPTLRVLDGKRFDPRFLKNKAKRQALEVRKKLKELGIEKPKKGHKLKETLSKSTAQGQDSASGSAAESDGGDDADRMDVDSKHAEPNKPTKRSKDMDARERRPKKPEATGAKKRSVSQREERSTEESGVRPKRTRKELPTVGGNALGRKSKATEEKTAKAKAKRGAFLVADDGDAEPAALAAKSPAAARANPKPTVPASTSKSKTGNKKQQADTNATTPSTRTMAKSAPSSTDEPSAVVASKDSVLAPPPSVTGVVAVVVAKLNKNGNGGKTGVDRANVVKELEKAAAKDEQGDGFGLGVGGWD